MSACPGTEGVCYYNCSNRPPLILQNDIHKSLCSKPVKITKASHTKKILSCFKVYGFVLACIHSYPEVYKAHRLGVPGRKRETTRRWREGERQNNAEEYAKHAIYTCTKTYNSLSSNSTSRQSVESNVNVDLSGCFLLW